MEKKRYIARWIENGTPLYNAVEQPTIEDAFEWLQGIVMTSIRHNATIAKAMITEETEHKVAQRYEVAKDGRLTPVGKWKNR